METSFRLQKHLYRYLKLLEAWKKQEEYGSTRSCSGQQVDEVDFA